MASTKRNVMRKQAGRQAARSTVASSSPSEPVACRSQRVCDRQSSRRACPSVDPETARRLRINGVKVNYWATCLRRLWLFSRHITLEHTSDRVALGRFLHETAYRHQDRRDVLVHELIRIDLLHQRNRLIEIKYSPKLVHAARLQLAYYLWYLKQLGAADLSGELRFPRQRRVQRVELTPELEQEVIKALNDIPAIESLPRPPQVEWQPYCKACAYCELCWG